MANTEDQPCFACGHPKSEHIGGGEGICVHLIPYEDPKVEEVPATQYCGCPKFFDKASM